MSRAIASNVRRRLALFLISFAVGFLGGCHGHRAPASTPYGIVNRGTYAYQRVNDGAYVVEATNQGSLSEALAEIGCGKAYVCLIEREGDIFSVEQRKK